MLSMTKLSCDNQNQTILDLPFLGNLPVKLINYLYLASVINACSWLPFCKRKRAITVWVISWNLAPTGLPSAEEYLLRHNIC